MAVPTQIHKPKNKVKNNKVTSYEAGSLMLKMAVDHLQNIGICSKGLMEVMMQTENPELALSFLSGSYKEPKLAGAVLLKERFSAFISYNPWTNKVLFNYERNKTKRIYIPETVEEKEVNADNYEQFEVSWSPNSKQKAISVTLPEMETITDECHLYEWEKAEVIVPHESDFERIPPSPFNEDIF